VLGEKEERGLYLVERGGKPKQVGRTQEEKKAPPNSRKGGDPRLTVKKKKTGFGPTEGGVENKEERGKRLAPCGKKKKSTGGKPFRSDQRMKSTKKTGTIRARTQGVAVSHDERKIGGRTRGHEKGPRNWDEARQIAAGGLVKGSEGERVSNSKKGESKQKKGFRERKGETSEMGGGQTWNQSQGQKKKSGERTLCSKMKGVQKDNLSWREREKRRENTSGEQLPR